MTAWTTSQAPTRVISGELVLAKTKIVTMLYNEISLRQQLVVKLIYMSRTCNNIAIRISDYLKLVFKGPIIKF